MKITLRKANALQLSINEMLKGMSFETTVSINEFQIPTTVISQTEEVFAKNLARRDALMMAMWRRKPNQDVIVHSDQGSQYGSDDRKRFCDANKLLPSMNR